MHQFDLFKLASKPEIEPVPDRLPNVVAPVTDNVPEAVTLVNAPVDAVFAPLLLYHLLLHRLHLRHPNRQFHQYIYL